MSKITNLNIGTPGTATAVAATNTKFTEVATATGAINGDNIRTQGVDRTNLNASTSSHLLTLFSYNNESVLGTPPVPWTIASNGTSAVPIESGANKAELVYGAGIILAEGDILRLHYTVHFKGHSRGTSAHQFTSVVPADPMCLVFPLWDITSASLTGYVNMPNQAELDRVSLLGDLINIDNYDGAQTVYRTDGTVVLDYFSAPDLGGERRPEQVGHGMLVYQHPVGAGALTVYGVKMHLRGQMRYQINAATTPDARAFRVTGQGVEEALASVDHKINWVQLMSMHMRNG